VRGPRAPHGLPAALAHDQAEGPRVTLDDVSDAGLARLRELFAADYDFLGGRFAPPHR
jgi:hypothetical protein